MTLTIQNTTIDQLRLSDQEVRQDLAIGLYSRRRVSLGKAAQIAGITSIAFQKILGELQIPLHYSLDDWQHDVCVVRETK